MRAKPETMTHKYELGQFVHLGKPAFRNGQASPDGLYEVTRLMPADQSGEFHYRLKSSAGERAARESEMVATSAHSPSSLFAT